MALVSSIRMTTISQVTSLTLYSAVFMAPRECSHCLDVPLIRQVVLEMAKCAIVHTFRFLTHFCHTHCTQNTKDGGLLMHEKTVIRTQSLSFYQEV